jgi:hypothetical protein
MNQTRTDAGWSDRVTLHRNLPDGRELARPRGPGAARSRERVTVGGSRLHAAAPPILVTLGARVEGVPVDGEH